MGEKSQRYMGGLAKETVVGKMVEIDPEKAKNQRLVKVVNSPIARSIIQLAGLFFLFYLLLLTPLNIFWWGGAWFTWGVWYFLIAASLMLIEISCKKQRLSLFITGVVAGSILVLSASLICTIFSPFLAYPYLDSFSFKGKVIQSIKLIALIVLEVWLWKKVVIDKWKIKHT